MNSRSDLLSKTKHVVLKFGSAVLLRDERTVDRPTFIGLVANVNELLDRGIRVTIVSSGAVALGRQRMHQEAMTDVELPRLQALAALGQAKLIQMYDREFDEYGRRVAQVLLGRDDLHRRSGFLNARLTLQTLHRMEAIPIINENDTVGTEELRFGDNDELAAATVGLVGADLLIILSDIGGIMERQGDVLGDRISRINCDDPHLDEVAGPSGSAFGRGGMVTKVRAARSAGRAGAATIIANGKQPNIVRAILDAEDVGTLVEPTDSSVTGRKVWLGAGARSSGRVRCDEGACRAIRSSGASLLPSGIAGVDGDFAEGAVIELVDADGAAFARGVSNYSAEQIRRIAGHKSSDIAAILGFKVLDSVVHRDDLVLL